MKEKRIQWFRIGEPEETLVEEGMIRELVVHRKKVCLARFQSTLFSFACRCPHAGGFLAEGSLNARGQVICPIHRYEYDIRNGFNSSGEGYFLITYPLQIREDGIYLGFEDHSLWDIFG